VLGLVGGSPMPSSEDGNMKKNKNVQKSGHKTGVVFHQGLHYKIHLFRLYSEQFFSCVLFRHKFTQANSIASIITILL